MWYFGLYMPSTDFFSPKQLASIHASVHFLVNGWKKIKIVTTFRVFLFYVHINWNIGIVNFYNNLNIYRRYVHNMHNILQTLNVQNKQDPGCTLFT